MFRIDARRSRVSRLLLAPPLHRRRNPHCLPVFGDVRRAMSMRRTQFVHDGVVGQHVAGRLAIDQLPSDDYRRRNASPPSAAAIDEVKKYFSFEYAAAGRMYLLAVTRETVRLVHADGIGHRLEIERGADTATPLAKKAVLLAHDLARHLRMVWLR